MDLPEFLHALGGDGKLVFASPEVRLPDPAEEAESVRCLEEMDARRRLEMAWEPPRLNREQGLWAARRLYRIGQFLVFRELPAEMITKELQDDCPGEDDVSRQYSVDLSFAWLPEMHRRAASISSHDELTSALVRLGGCYPLSFVRADSAKRFEQLWGDRALRALFVDRVIAGRVRECVGDERVLTAVLDALGSLVESADWLPKPTEG